MTEQLDAGLVAEQIEEHPDALSQPYAGGELGRGRRRKEDARLVTGQTNWTDNITLPGLLHMAVLRSPMAHARITRGRRLGRARACPAWSPPSAAPTSPTTWARRCRAPGRSPRTWSSPAHPPLAIDEVRYVGDGVAVVVARDRYPAADALEAIEVDYEPLPAVLDMEAALADGAPLVHSDKGTNKCYTVRRLGAGGDYDETAQGQATTPSWCAGGYVQQRLIPTRDGAARASSWPRSRRRTSSRSGRPPRSRTSCGSCWR